jgi:hypothetical protein
MKRENSFVWFGIVLLIWAFLAMGLWSNSTTITGHAIDYSCDEGQRIIRISGITNAFGALYNQGVNYKDICYDDLFGYTYIGNNPHVCNNKNNVVYLNKNLAAFGAVESSGFPEPIGGVWNDYSNNEISNKWIYVKSGQINGGTVYTRLKDDPTKSYLVSNNMDIELEDSWIYIDQWLIAPIVYQDGEMYKWDNFWVSSKANTPVRELKGKTIIVQKNGNILEIVSTTQENYLTLKDAVMYDPFGEQGKWVDYSNYKLEDRVVYVDSGLIRGDSIYLVTSSGDLRWNYPAINLEGGAWITIDNGELVKGSYLYEFSDTYWSASEKSTNFTSTTGEIQVYTSNGYIFKVKNSYKENITLENLIIYDIKGENTETPSSSYNIEVCYGDLLCRVDDLGKGKSSEKFLFALKQEIEGTFSLSETDYSHQKAVYCSSKYQQDKISSSYIGKAYWSSDANGINKVSKLPVGRYVYLIIKDLDLDLGKEIEFNVREGSTPVWGRSAGDAKKISIVRTKGIVSMPLLITQQIYDKTSSHTNYIFDARWDAPQVTETWKSTSMSIIPSSNAEAYWSSDANGNTPITKAHGGDKVYMIYKEDNIKTGDNGLFYIYKIKVEGTTPSVTTSSLQKITTENGKIALEITIEDVEQYKFISSILKADGTTDTTKQSATSNDLIVEDGTCSPACPVGYSCVGTTCVKDTTPPTDPDNPGGSPGRTTRCDDDSDCYTAIGEKCIGRYCRVVVPANEGSCEGVICSAPQICLGGKCYNVEEPKGIPLPFFNWINFVVALTIISGIYYLKRK